MDRKRFSAINVPGEIMTVALVILCVGAVTFLLRFLAALVTEGINSPSKTAGVDFARFNPSRRRGELIEMNPEQNKRVPARRGERRAI
jgi:hypothetical protein